jgi:hypothetical protein
MYVLSIIYLRPLNLKSTASGVSGASLACGPSRESLESGASRPSEGENGRLKIEVAENMRSLLHFRVALPRALPKAPPQEFHPFALHLLSQRLALLNVQACKE